MKNYFRFFSLLLITLIVYSCGNSTKPDLSSEKSKREKHNYDYEGDKLIVTDKIMYDVSIVNELIGDRSKNNPDWFWENLPVPDAIDFLQTLLEDAVSGKLKTYYYDPSGDYESFDLIAESDLKTFMDEKMVYKFEVIDTTVKRYKTKDVEIKLDYTHVKKLRFLEEWFLADGKMYKRVIAVAPYFVIEYPGMETVNSVFFWIFLDEEK